MDYSEDLEAIIFNSLEEMEYVLIESKLEFNEYIFNKIKYIIKCKINFTVLFYVQIAENEYVHINISSENLIIPLQNCLTKFEQYEQYELCVECFKLIKKIKKNGYKHL